MKEYFKLFKLAIKGTEEDLTKGSIRRAIFLLSIPMILEMVMESLFAVVDIFFVGRISTDAVATVGLTESVITIVFAVAIGLSMGVTAMVARRIGEKKTEEASAVAAQAIIFGILVSILLGVLGYIYAEDILRLMGGSESLIASGKWYTKILFGTNVVIMLLFLLNGVFRGAGDASSAMKALWIANGLNIILDPIFIFGIGPIEGMGIQGAAVASAIGRGCGVLYQLYILFNGNKIVKLKLQDFKAQWDIIIKLIKLGAGGAGQFVISSMSWAILVYILAHNFSESIVAGYTIAIRVIIFSILPAWGMANAASTLVGQNLGAKNPNRAEESVWKTAKYNTYFLVAVALIMIVFANQIIALFTDDKIAIETGTIALQIISIGYVVFGYGMVISQSFNGAGDTKTPTIINFISFWLIEIPMAYLLAVYLDVGHTGVYWAMIIAETVLAILCVYFFKQGKWKKTVV